MKHPDVKLVFQSLALQAFSSVCVCMSQQFFVKYTLSKQATSRDCLADWVNLTEGLNAAHERIKTMPLCMLYELTSRQLFLAKHMRGSPSRQYEFVCIMAWVCYICTVPADREATKTCVRYTCTLLPKEQDHFWDSCKRVYIALLLPIRFEVYHTVFLSHWLKRKDCEGCRK